MTPWDFDNRTLQRLSMARMERHRHRLPYATLVLRGRYRENSDSGSWEVEAGDVLIHQPFESHLNEIGRSGAVVLNLPAPSGLPVAFRIADPETILRKARRDPEAASRMLSPIATLDPVMRDWPEMLAARLRGDPMLVIGAWAEEQGLAPETVSRGFRAAFGTTAARYRAERRARDAWGRLITGKARSLADLAYDCGFSDQAHLTRAVRALTGAPPGQWVNSVQDSAGRAR